MNRMVLRSLTDSMTVWSMMNKLHTVSPTPSPVLLRNVDSCSYTHTPTVSHISSNIIVHKLHVTNFESMKHY